MTPLARYLPLVKLGPLLMKSQVSSFWSKNETIITVLQYSINRGFQEKKTEQYDVYFV
jgi:hypothetical protein